MPRFVHEPVLARPTSPARQNTDPFVFGPSFLYSNCRQFTHQLGPTCLHVGRGYGRAPHAARHERRPVATLTEDQLRVRSLAWAGEWAQLSVAWTIWRRAGGQLTGR